MTSTDPAIPSGRVLWRVVSEINGGQPAIVNCVSKYPEVVGVEAPCGVFV